MSKRKVGRPKLNLVRFTVTTTPEVKQYIERVAAQNIRSLAVEAGRLLAEAVGLESAPQELDPHERTDSGDTLSPAA